MKKLIVISLASITILIAGYFIWWNLPLTFNRRSDIKRGEAIIKNIENYQKSNGLPDNNDWETLRKFGFIDKTEFLQPEYRRLDTVTFESLFLEGFDGPYVMWNSKERIWKKGYPTFPKGTK